MITIKSPGGYDHLVFEELKNGQPTKGANLREESKSSTVVVDVHGCGVNYADVIARWGFYKTATRLVGWPLTPGFEFSGTVASVGDAVTKFKVGDKVFGVTQFGAYSEKVVVPECQLFHLPSTLTLSEAGCFPTVALTAWYALVESCRLRPGNRILIHSAAGGVGGMLIQLGKIFQCYVVGVVGSSHKVEEAHSLGCDAVIDKSKEDLWAKAREYANSEGYTAVFDPNGVETLRNSYEITGKGGRLVVYGFQSVFPKSTKDGHGQLSWFNLLSASAKYFRTPSFNPGEMLDQNKSVMAFNLSSMFSQMALMKEGMEQMLKWVEEGKLKPLKCKEYLLSDAGSAHRDLESGLTTGKLVLLSREAWTARQQKEPAGGLQDQQEEVTSINQKEEDKKTDCPQEEENNER